MILLWSKDYALDLFPSPGPAVAWMLFCVKILKCNCILCRGLIWNNYQQNLRKKEKTGAQVWYDVGSCERHSSFKKRKEEALSNLFEPTFGDPSVVDRQLLSSACSLVCYPVDFDSCCVPAFSWLMADQTYLEFLPPVCSVLKSVGHHTLFFHTLCSCVRRHWSCWEYGGGVHSSCRWHVGHADVVACCKTRYKERLIARTVKTQHGDPQKGIVGFVCH